MVVGDLIQQEKDKKKLFLRGTNDLNREIHMIMAEMTQCYVVYYTFFQI